MRELKTLFITDAPIAISIETPETAQPMSAISELANNKPSGITNNPKKKTLKAVRLAAEKLS